MPTWLPEDKASRRVVARKLKVHDRDQTRTMQPQPRAQRRQQQTNPIVEKPSPAPSAACTYSRGPKARFDVENRNKTRTEDESSTLQHNPLGTRALHRYRSTAPAAQGAALRTNTSQRHACALRQATAQKYQVRHANAISAQRAAQRRLSMQFLSYNIQRTNAH